MDNSSDQVEKQPSCWNVSTTSVQSVTVQFLGALKSHALWVLRNSLFQVIATAKSAPWTYYPVHEEYCMGQELLPYEINPRVEIEILLAIGADRVAKHQQRMTLAALAHLFGHVLADLRNPGWIHECPDADRAAREAGLTQFVRSSRRIYERHERNSYRELSELPGTQRWILRHEDLKRG